jgi:CRP/FNR family transcriptional regulator, dissimilatory nitrate respiration regulator
MHKALQNCILFKGIAPPYIEKFVNEVFFKVSEYEQGDIIAGQDETVRGVIIVLEGTVRGEMIDLSGKTIIIEEMDESTPLAPAFLFGKQNKYPVNIVAQTEVKTIFFPKDSFLKLLNRNENILSNYLNIVSNKAQFLAYKLRYLSFHSIKGKFAFYILNLARNSNSNNIRLPLAQSKLAELFGVTRPSLGRAIREMHNDGFIIANGKNIQIVNTFELYELIQ